MTTNGHDGRISAAAREALLSKYTSRQNKLWCATGWKHHRGWHIEWKWEPFRSRLRFQFEPGGEFVQAKSYDDDIRPKLKWDKPKKKQKES